MDQVIEEGDSDIPPTPASSRPTPRLTPTLWAPLDCQVVQASPPPPPPNFSTSFARSSVAATGSPFHRLSFPDVGKPSPSTGEDRWPTRIVFYTSSRPSQQKKMAVEERVPLIKSVAQPRAGQKFGIPPIVRVVVMSLLTLLRSIVYSPRSGFNLDDEEMDEPFSSAPEETNESSAEASKAQSRAIIINLRTDHPQPRKKTRRR
ncbi:hypothetical protein Pst134EB_005846 [Puccinia striiformis f. sp. tritici]|nr:hypothetical protein Pst134EB_005846 [Puccinia striiformis f. sp. tritici]